MADNNAAAIAAPIAAIVIRSDADDPQRLLMQAGADQPFSVIFSDTGRMEIIFRGLAFDLEWPAKPFDRDAVQRRYGDGIADIDNGGWRIIRLSPGEHVAAAGHQLPLMLAALDLATCLAETLNAAAIIWLPSGVMGAPAFARQMLAAHAEGGPLPVPLLVDWHRLGDDSMETRGLAHRCGHELRFDPAGRLSPDEAARLIIRLIHGLLESGSSNQPQRLSGLTPRGDIMLDFDGNRLVAWLASTG